MYSNDSFDLKKNNYTLNMKEALKNCTIEGSNKITIWDKQSNAQKTSILLSGFDQKDYSKVLEILKWEEKKRDLSLVEHINVILLGLMRIVFMADRRDATAIRGI